MAKINFEITFETEVRNQFVKSPQWDKEKGEYICQHCGYVVPTSQMAYGWHCPTCGLPIQNL